MPFSSELEIYSRLYFCGHDLKTSCEKTVSTLQLILKRTFDYASKQTGGTKMSANTELRLIQSLNDIQTLKVLLKQLFESSFSYFSLNFELIVVCV
jgi:hypothetical protein